MIVIHHNKDLDGYSSGAICKRKYPEAKLIGWDYSEPIPDFKEFVGEDVIMIDISFPIDKIEELSRISRLTIIDHHISFYKEVESKFKESRPFIYVYELGKAACEIGWEYLFPEEEVPYAITLLGRYDTWRQKEGDWERETLPFQYAMRVKAVSAETFPSYILEKENSSAIQSITVTGKDILKYQEQMDMLACERSAFSREFEGLRAICLNTRAFSSNTLKSVYNPEEHDIMVGFEYTGRNWTVSLRSTGDKVDCSVIAKNRGGGGHKNAAGFETNSFEEIWTKKG